MDLMIKEYGGLIMAIIGFSMGMALLGMIVQAGRVQSRVLIADITGVSYENTQYIQDIEE